MIDLHAHTTASDGTFSPRALVELARTTGVTTLAVTDHDTVAGLSGAIATGAELGVEIIPGVEFSTSHRPGTMHLLGYGFDPAATGLLGTLEGSRRARDERNPRIAEKLRGLGFDVTLAEVEAVAGGGVVGRPHFARVLMQKGVVASINEAFEKYFNRGGPAYAAAERISPADAIAAIRGAGGVAVLAHPYQLRAASDVALEEIVTTLQAAGLQGIEAYYSRHRPAQVAAYRSLAERHGLLVTGGSDFHGSVKPDIALGTGCGDLRVPVELLGPLKANFRAVGSV